LLDNGEAFSLLKKMVLLFWHGEKMPSEWNVNVLKVLPKKGNLKLPGNYRGIMMMEVACKIVCKILLGRLTPIKGSIDHENQCGFRPYRGACQNT
jgi:hypothetical protein